MGFEEILEIFAENFSHMCVIIGGLMMLLGLVSVFNYIDKSMAYTMLGIAFMLFPMAAQSVFKKEYAQSPPPLIKKKEAKK